MESFKINNIKIKSKGILAPMLDFSTLPFRLICNENGAGLTYTEMVHINHITSQPLDSINELNSCRQDTPTSVQLVGNFKHKELTLKAAYKLDSYKYFDIIDLNLGCPSEKIVSGKSGSYFLKELDSILPVIKELKETCKKPITVKTRLGFSKNQIDLISKKLINTGIDALAIHARTATQSYGVSADVEAVRKIKKNSSIPIIYNGDINQENFVNYLDFQGIMVGRFALGNPSIFNKINHYVKTNNLKDFDNSYNLIQLHKFFKLAKKYNISFFKIKISSLQFLKGFKEASILRNKISQAKNINELIEILNKIKAQ